MQSTLCLLLLMQGDADDYEDGYEQGTGFHGVAQQHVDNAGGDEKEQHRFAQHCHNRAPEIARLGRGQLIEAVALQTLRGLQVRETVPLLPGGIPGARRRCFACLERGGNRPFAPRESFLILFRLAPL